MSPTFVETTSARRPAEALLREIRTDAESRGKATQAVAMQENNRLKTKAGLRKKCLKCPPKAWALGVPLDHMHKTYGLKKRANAFATFFTFA
jgi:hypothetical protein